MSRFDEIYARAVRNKGGEKALNALLPRVAEPVAIAALDESRFLAEMSRSLFQAGFRFSVINNKWPGFEAVFHGFDVNTILGLLPEDWEEIGNDARIVRVQRNIRAVRANARFIEDMAFEYGGIGMLIADWPESDLVGLLTLLKRRGSRLGGNNRPALFAQYRQGHLHPRLRGGAVPADQRSGDRQPALIAARSSPYSAAVRRLARRDRVPLRPPEQDRRLFDWVV